VPAKSGFRQVHVESMISFALMEMTIFRKRSDPDAGAGVNYVHEALARICAVGRRLYSPHLRPALCISRRLFGPLCTFVSRRVQRPHCAELHGRTPLHRKQASQYDSWLA
jgi:hypothetical protein